MIYQNLWDKAEAVLSRKFKKNKAPKSTTLQFEESEKVQWKWKSTSHVWLLAAPWTVTPWRSSVLGDSLGKNTGLGCHSLLQGIFPTQGMNPSLLHCRWILYHLSHQGNSYWAREKKNLNWKLAKRNNKNKSRDKWNKNNRKTIGKINLKTWIFRKE